MATLPLTHVELTGQTKFACILPFYIYAPISGNYIFDVTADDTFEYSLNESFFGRSGYAATGAFEGVLTLNLNQGYNKFILSYANLIATGAYCSVRKRNSSILYYYPSTIATIAGSSVISCIPLVPDVSILRVGITGLIYYQSGSYTGPGSMTAAAIPPSNLASGSYRLPSPSAYLAPSNDVNYYSETGIPAAPNPPNSKAWLAETSFLTSPLPVEQTISAFATIAGKTPGVAPFTITPPTASSGLPVAVSVISGPATISGNTVTLTGTAGVVVLAANQAGNTNYKAAPQVTTSFIVSVAPMIPSNQVVIGETGKALSYQVINSGQVATSWTATGMPVGLSISASGVISGTVAVDGNSVVTVTARNAGGSSSQRVGVSIIYSGKQYHWHEAEWALRSNNSIKARRLNWFRKTKAGTGTNMWITFSNPFFYMGENGAKTALVQSGEFGTTEFTTPDWVLDLNDADPDIVIPPSIKSLRIAPDTAADFIWGDIDPIPWDPNPPPDKPQPPKDPVFTAGVFWAHKGAGVSSECVTVELTVTTSDQSNYTVNWGDKQTAADSKETTAASGTISSASYCPVAGAGLVIGAWGDPHWVITGPVNKYSESFAISGLVNGNTARIIHNTDIPNGQQVWLYECNNKFLNGTYTAKVVNNTSFDLLFVNGQNMPSAITGKLSRVTPSIQTAKKMLFGDNAAPETVLLLFLKYQDGSEWCVHSTNTVYSPNGAQIISEIAIIRTTQTGVITRINPVNLGPVRIGTFCTIEVSAGGYLQPRYYGFGGQNITHIGGAMWGMFQASQAADGQYRDFGDGSNHDGYGVMGATIGYTRKMWVDASTLLRNNPGLAPGSLYDNNVIVPFSNSVYLSLCQT
jgi:hypothetical protein